MLTSSSLKIFTLCRIPVYVHFTLFLMLGLIAIFSTQMAAIWTGAMCFVLMHEFGHSLAAQWCGLNVRSITMLPVGGVAAIEGLKGNDPRKELLITFAGPFVNAALVTFLSPFVLMTKGMPEMWAAIVVTAWWINIILFLFNMIPCFPMDGGRIFRASLCLCWGDIVKATRVAVWTGRVFAVLFVALGIMMFAPMWAVIGLVMILLGEAEYRAVQQSVQEDELIEQIRSAYGENRDL